MHASVIVRPIENQDLDALFEMAKASGTGFTTLPANRDYLAKRIQLSLDSFKREDADCRGEYYLFVLEDLASCQVIGTCAVAGHVGSDEVFYSYRVGKLTKQCSQLGIRNEHQTLTITTDFQGATEVCTLFLMPEFRQNKNGQLLARSRYLFLAEQQARFADPVIAELRGVSDDNGHSPFWDAIGRKFYGVEFPQADYLTGMSEKQFISDLMPEYPIYYTMLPQSARDAIAEVHEQTKPAKKLIEREGFRYSNYVDLFDGGPTMRCQFENIRSVKNSRVAEVSTIMPEVSSELYIIGTRQLDYRCVLGRLCMNEDGSVSITDETAQALNLAEGASIRFIETD